MRPTVDIIEELIASFEPTSHVTAVQDLGSGLWWLTICNLYNTRDKSTIKINGVDYVVLEFDSANSKIKINGGATIFAKHDVFTPPAFYYFHGTPIATGNELSKILNAKNKTPLAYLLEVTRDNFIADKTSRIDRNSNIRIFFLDQSNYKDWDTDQHYSNVIQPMANYATEWIKSINDNGLVGLIAEYELTYHAKFGISISQRGHDTNLFPDHLSGVEIQMTLPITRELACSGC